MFASDRHIIKRRAEEQRLGNLTQLNKADWNMKAKADWENKAAMLDKQKLVDQRVKLKENEYHEQVEDRRAKLSALLLAEEEMYAQEFIASQETPEQVRDNMRLRLAELQQKYKEQNSNEVMVKKDVQFKRGTDDLRTLMTKQNRLEMQIYNESQMFEKVQKRDREMDEEAIYSEIWNLDRIQKENREKEEKAAKEKLIKERMDFLDYQAVTQTGQREADKHALAEEKSMLRDQYARELDNQRREEIDRIKSLRAENMQIISQNATERSLKEAKAEVEKESEKARIQGIVDMETELDNKEKEIAQYMKEEAKKFQEHAGNRRNEDKERERYIEYLIEQENQKRLAASDAKYATEQQARLELMKNVYADRDGAIIVKKDVIKAEKESQILEQEAIKARFLREEAEEVERKANYALKKKRHQGEVIGQIGDKDMTGKRGKQQEMLERRIALLAEKEYQDKIQKEKVINEENILRLKGNRPF